MLINITTCMFNNTYKERIGSKVNIDWYVTYSNVFRYLSSNILKINSI